MSLCAVVPGFSLQDGEFIVMSGDFRSRWLGASHPVKRNPPMPAVVERCNPTRNAVIERPHAAVRLADLRPFTRAGNQLAVRIAVDPVPPRLIPLVVVRTSGPVPYFGWMARPVAANVWEFNVLRQGGYPPDTEMFVYLIAR
jgi:hypothetical protein